MIYGYARVSSKEQNLARQVEALKNYTSNIFQDKESGKDFERKEYKKLMRRLKKDDTLVIKSIDRLGRNYDLIIEEWRKITKDIGANIKVLDMPLLDTSQTNGLTGKFISDLVLQILSYVAEQERIFIKERQAEGIRIAKEQGVKFGRPTMQISDDILLKYHNGELYGYEAYNLVGVSKMTFFKRYNEWKQTQTNAKVVKPIERSKNYKKTKKEPLIIWKPKRYFTDVKNFERIIKSEQKVKQVSKQKKKKPLNKKEIADLYYRFKNRRNR